MKKRPNSTAEAWCSQHECHPNDCFETHHPEIPPGAISANERTQEIVRKHIRLQNESISSQSEQMSCKIVEERKKNQDKDPQPTKEA